MTEAEILKLGYFLVLSEILKKKKLWCLVFDAGV